MINLNISAVPSQEFTVNLDSNLWDITIKQVANQTTIVNGVVTSIQNVIMSCDVIFNGTILQQGMRVIAGTLLLPYHYEENGNFILTTMNGDYPDYTQFGITQSLFYLSAAELAQVRALNEAALNAGA